MCTRNLTGSKWWIARKARNLNAICESTAKKMWEPWRLTALWSSTACYRDNYIWQLITQVLRTLSCWEPNSDHSVVILQTLNNVSVVRFLFLTNSKITAIQGRGNLITGFPLYINWNKYWFLMTLSIATKFQYVNSLLFSLSLTTCFGPYGPSSGEIYN
jgi:hypothetical protein